MPAYYVASKTAEFALADTSIFLAPLDCRVLLNGADVTKYVTNRSVTARVPGATTAWATGAIPGECVFDAYAVWEDGGEKWVTLEQKIDEIGRQVK